CPMARKWREEDDMTWLGLATSGGTSQRDAPWLWGFVTHLSALERGGSTLGSARAARDWRWAAEPAPRRPVPVTAATTAVTVPTRIAAARTRLAAAPMSSKSSAASVLRVPPALLRAMSVVARDNGLP